MNSVIKISVGKICLDIYSEDTTTDIIHRIESGLRSVYVGNNIETHVNDYLEDSPEDCEDKYIFNEYSLMEFVSKIIELTENSREQVRKESVDMFEKVKEEISKYNEVLK